MDRTGWTAPLRRYERDQRRRGLAETSIRTRLRILRQLASLRAEPWDVTPDEIDDWLDDPRKSMGTRRCYLSAVSGFYRWAIRSDLTLVNPVDKLDRPRLGRALPRPITVADLTAAIDGAPPRIRAWILLAARQGLRCQEIAGLDREDVLEHNDPGVLLVRHAKGGRERAVPLHPGVLAHLRHMGLPRSGPLFPNRLGAAFTPNVVSKHINQYLHGAGITATAHQLRHRFATDVYRESRDLRMTQELLGHQSPQTTAIYAAWSPTEAVGVVRRLGLAQATLW